MTAATAKIPFRDSNGISHSTAIALMGHNGIELNGGV
jgi:hypothetical protein